MRRVDALKQRLSFNDWAKLQGFSYGGVPYRPPFVTSPLSSTGPRPTEDGDDLISTAHLHHPVISAAAYTRALVMSQVKFQWRNLETRRIWGSAELSLLEQPMPGMSGNQLLAQSENHVGYHGQAYFHRPAGDTIELLDPPKIAVVGEIRNGVLVPSRYYEYETRAGVGDPVRDIPAERVVHWPGLDLNPRERFLGTSWVRSCWTEIAQDFQASTYIDKFFQNGAVPSIMVSVPMGYTEEEVEQFAELARNEYGGVESAHKIMFVGNGSDVHEVGSKVQDLALKELRGEFESRVAARSRVPSVILQVPTVAVTGGSSLNQGNYTVTRRVWADTWFTPTVNALCRALQRIVPAPSGSELWWDPTDIQFLQEDRADEAKILKDKAGAMQALFMSGYLPDTITEAIDNNELALLEHSGILSVQVQQVEPGAAAPVGETDDDAD